MSRKLEHRRDAGAQVQVVDEHGGLRVHAELLLEKIRGEDLAHLGDFDATSAWP